MLRQLLHGADARTGSDECEGVENGDDEFWLGVVEGVALGQAFATVGSSGLATAPHLHFEVLVHGNNVDPIKFLAATHTPTLAAPTPTGGHD